ncbi:TRAP transporter small permease [Nitrospinae bacterium AH_259_B05_G02_I21]|nr:TRAP transporter small permease [Nitrospinae bacterium AH_259_B05_G02_I21]MDA2931755.1 TRAP transporter small permease [Nitrospinae bacterium AH-259-F20]
MKALQRLDDWLAALEGWSLVALVSLMVVLAFSQVVLRNLFRLGLPWADIVLRQMVMWASFLGASLATRQGRHIAIDVVSRFLPSGARQWLATAIHAAACLISVLLASAAWTFVAAERLGQGLLLKGLPTWWAQLIIPIGFGLMAFRFGLRAILFATGRLEPRVLEESPG